MNRLLAKKKQDFSGGGKTTRKSRTLGENGIQESWKICWRCGGDARNTADTGELRNARFSDRAGTRACRKFVSRGGEAGPLDEKPAPHSLGGGAAWGKSQKLSESIAVAKFTGEGGGGRGQSNRIAIGGMFFETDELRKEPGSESASKA